MGSLKFFRVFKERTAKLEISLVNQITRATPDETNIFWDLQLERYKRGDIIDIILTGRAV